jgi:hypothetical protein
MKSTKLASFSNNVAEFAPGNMVIQVYPVARPIIGIVTGSNRVEGKVYVSWSGRVAQHDPEELQLASCTPFFSFPSGGKIASEELSLFRRYVSALRTASQDENATSETFREALVKEKFANDEADELTKCYIETLKAHRASLGLDPVLPKRGDSVVILSNGGKGPGIVGLLVAMQDGEAVVDVHTSWTSRRDGSNLVKIPLAAVVPISTSWDRPVRGVTAEAQSQPAVLNLPEAFSTATRLYVDSLVRAGSSYKYACPCGEAWVEVTATKEADRVNPLVKVAAFGQYANVSQAQKLLEQQTEINVRGNEEDLRNSLEKVKSLVDTAKSAAMQFVREKLTPDFVEHDQRRFLKENAGKLLGLTHLE